MLSGPYLRKRYEEGYKVGYEIGRERGRRLEKERRRRYKARFLAWDERRLRARAEGEPFDEPEPILGDEGVAYEDILTEAERAERRAKLRPYGSVGVWIRVGRLVCRSFRR